MLYRTFPKLPDIPVSVLGFGMMRLPLLPGKNDDESAIDEKAAELLVQTAYEQGINYYDTAYIYHGGKSEEVLGRILRKLNIRDKVYIADKMPLWSIRKESEWETVLNTQLERLGTDYIDFYLLHSLTDKSWQTVQRLNGTAFLEKARAQGKIRHIGFSFHHEPETFRSIIDGYDNWEFCQIQYNYLDETYQAGTGGMQYAHSKNIGVISMEPLRGGLLANVPQDIIEIFAAAPVPRMPAEWALRWVWEHQEITLALSGMGTVNQVLTNCAAASAAKPNSLPQVQMQTIKKAADRFKMRIRVPCTGCSYCMPCPAGVAIPDIFSEYNTVSMKGAFENGSHRTVSRKYRFVRASGQGADKCIHCGACIRRCPQHIAIPDILQSADTVLQ